MRVTNRNFVVARFPRWLEVWSFCLVLVFMAMFGVAGCGLFDRDEPIEEFDFFVYGNTAQAFHRVSFGETVAVRNIPMPELPNTTGIYNMAASSDGATLYFTTEGPWPNPVVGFVPFDVNTQMFGEQILTDFPYSGLTSLLSARSQEMPGLMYVYMREQGTHVLDLSTGVKHGKLSEQFTPGMRKVYAFSPDGGKLAVHNRTRSISEVVEEIAIYSASTIPAVPSKILGEAGSDSISTSDIVFSKSGEELFVAFQLSEGRSREIESYLGSYDLDSGTLKWAEQAFPWSLNPYYLAYSAQRNEIYMVGTQDQLYIVDAKNLRQKATVKLSGKVEGASRLMVSPLETVLMVSCSDSDAIYAVDLESRTVARKIQIRGPYLMTHTTNME